MPSVNSNQENENHKREKTTRGRKPFKVWGLYSCSHDAKINKWPTTIGIEVMKPNQQINA